jgi:hypothetical protein
LVLSGRNFEIKLHFLFCCQSAKFLPMYLGTNFLPGRKVSA